MKFDDKQVKRELRKYERKVQQPRKVLNDIAKHEIKAAQTRIRTRKSDPDGKKWKSWSYATLIQRIREGSAAKGLLYKSGLLVRSFWSQISRNELKISNKAPYAGYLQSGTSKMPARPFLGWGRKARSEAERAVVEYLKK